MTLVITLARQRALDPAVSQLQMVGDCVIIMADCVIPGDACATVDSEAADRPIHLCMLEVIDMACCQAGGWGEKDREMSKACPQKHNA